MSGHVARMGERKVVHRVLVGNSQGERPLGDLGVDMRIILKCVFKKWDGGIDWNFTAQDTDRWQDLVNAVMNLRVL